MLVLFYHVRTPQNLELTFGPLDAFSKYGFLGVDIFFVLSGFILSHVYQSKFDRRGARAYAVARFSRIYPLHLVTILLMLGAYSVAHHLGVKPTEESGDSLLGTVAGLLLVQEWFGLIAPNPGSWSISIEFANYLIFPLILLLPRCPRYLAPIVILVGALVVKDFDGYRVLRSMTEFVLGVAAYSLATRYSYPFKGLAALSGFFFVLPFIASAWVGQALSGFAALCFAVTMVLLAGNREEPFKRLCSSKPLVFLGDISYSVYLLQWFIWIGWKHGIAHLSLFAAHPYFMIVCAALSVVVAAVPSFYLFERPCRSMLRRALSSAPRSRVNVSLKGL